MLKKLSGAIPTMAWRYPCILTTILISASVAADDYYSLSFSNARKNDTVTIIEPRQETGRRYPLSQNQRLPQLHANTKICYHTSQKNPLTAVKYLNGSSKQETFTINANQCAVIGGVKSSLFQSILNTSKDIIRMIKDPKLLPISAYAGNRDEQNPLTNDDITYCNIYPYQRIEPRHYPKLSIPFHANYENMEVLLTSDMQGQHILAKTVINQHRADFYDIDLNHYQESDVYVIFNQGDKQSILTLMPVDIKNLRNNSRNPKNIFVMNNEPSYGVWENDINYNLSILSSEFDISSTNTKRNQARELVVYALNDTALTLNHLENTEHQNHLKDFLEEYYYHRCTKE